MKMRTVLKPIYLSLKTLKAPRPLKLKDGSLWWPFDLFELDVPVKLLWLLH
jgi:hypothetical protein